MSANAKRSVICLPSFGCVTGLRFDRGGSAEVLMTRPELSRLLRAWRTYETGKKKPDDKLVAALETLLRKVYGHFDVPMVAEVPIARWKAKLTPIVHGPEEEKADLFRGEDLGKKSNRRIFG